jgi:hypothetical protein
MKFRDLETVVLERDIPERGLHGDDLGAVRSIGHGVARLRFDSGEINDAKPRSVALR